MSLERLLRRAALAALLALGACSDASSPASSGNIPSPIGDPVEVTARDGWRLVAQRSEFGQCLELSSDDGSEYACGFEVPDRHDVSYFAAKLGSDRFIAGPVVEGAATVRLELLDHEPVDVAPIAADIGMDVYVLQVPAGRCDRVVALGPDGEELDAVELPEDPWAP